MSRLYLYLEAFWCQTLVATPQEHIEAFLNKTQWDYREANHCRYHQQKLLDACEDCRLTVLIRTSCLRTDCCHGAHQNSDATSLPPWGEAGFMLKPCNVCQLVQICHEGMGCDPTRNFCQLILEQHNEGFFPPVFFPPY